MLTKKTIRVFETSRERRETREIVKKHRALVVELVDTKDLKLSK